MSTDDLEPLLTLPARLGWTLDRTYIYGAGADNPPTEQELKFIPSFECGLDLAGEWQNIVLDLKALMASAKRQGGYYLLNCECGDPDDAGIEEMLFVNYPDADSIVWEFDVQGYRSALSKESWLTCQSGYVRLEFDRKQYETALRDMAFEAKKADAALELYGVAPNDYGFAEYLLQSDCDLDFVVEPILPPGSHLEFRLEGSELCWLDGKRLRSWPASFFPCWTVNQAFKKWCEFVRRGLPGRDAAKLSTTNYFYLLDENGRAACDAAGNTLVQKLRMCLNQGANPPDIALSYGLCVVPAITEFGAK